MGKTMVYWKKIFGIELSRINYYSKWLLYKVFGWRLPKLRDQRGYWIKRGLLKSIA